MGFRKGDRVRLNEQGKERARHPNRLGTWVSGRHHDIVHWDGTKSPQPINFGYIELAEPEKEDTVGMEVRDRQGR